MKKVRKKSGYDWPGVVVADFLTTSGERRIVVECTVPEVAGALHIYAPEQMEMWVPGTGVGAELTYGHWCDFSTAIVA